MKMAFNLIFSALLILTIIPIKAQTNVQESVLYSFGRVSTDGTEPRGGLIQGRDGNFYGTTTYGGSGNDQNSDSGTGTFIKITPGGVEKVLYSFGSVPNDGECPVASLIQGSDGNFYGTTSGGGTGQDQYGNVGVGTVFKITPGGVETVLHSFGSVSNDGEYPYASLIQGSDGNFYGTTESGGSSGDGTVFKITPAGVESVLYSFGSVPNDGKSPAASLIQGSDGNLYGTTSGGGTGQDQYGDKGLGTVFRITPTGVETVLYSFGSVPNDGESPVASLIQGSDGNFYGTTYQGGTGQDQYGNVGVGTVFKITPGGVETVLHDFGVNDGEYPSASLIQGSDGNFYGTTMYGGNFNGITINGFPSNGGTFFKITPAGVESVLYNFGRLSNDAEYPSAPIIRGRDGNFYGTTFGGGSSYEGAVFELTLPSLFPTPVAGTSCSSIDIGNVGVPGNASFNVLTSGIATLQGSGAGIGVGNGGDGFQFMGVLFSGDSTLIAQITNQTGGGESGIMFRLNNSLYSPFISVVYQKGVGTVLKWNYATDSAAIVLGADNSPTIPAYVGLVRSGDTFIGYEFVNGAWQVLGTLNAPGTQSNYEVGLVESSDQYSVLGTATFDDVQLCNFAE